MSRRERRWVGRGARRLDAHHPCPRAATGERRRDAGGEPPSPHRDQDGRHVRALLEDLQTEGALPGHHVGMVERMDEHGAGLLGVLPRGTQGLVDGVAGEAHLGTVGTRRLLLGDRRAHRHEHGGLGVEQPRRQRDSLRVVTGARRHDATVPGLLVEPGDAYVGATDLERSGALEVFALEVDGTTDPVRQPPRALHRRDPRDATEQPPRLLDVGEQCRRIGSGRGRIGGTDAIGRNHERSVAPRR